MRHLVRGLVVSLAVACGLVLAVGHSAAWAGLSELRALDDNELRGVTAGDLDIQFGNDSLTFIQGNEAHTFSFDIGQGAFANAQGVFTTISAVNSAVNLDVIVNIYLGTQGF